MVTIKNIKWDVVTPSERERIMISKEIGLPAEVTLLKINYDNYNTNEIDDLLYREYNYPAYKYDVEKTDIDLEAQARGDKEYIEFYRSLGYEPILSDEILNLVVNFKPIAKTMGKTN